MARYVDLLEIRVRFLPGIGEDPVEEWVLSGEVEGQSGIDEDALDDAVQAAVEQLHGQTTFEFERKLRSGGWGASGATVLDILITVAEGLAGNVLYALLFALYKRFAKAEPENIDRKKIARKR